MMHLYLCLYLLTNHFFYFNIILFLLPLPNLFSLSLSSLTFPFSSFSSLVSYLLFGFSVTFTFLFIQSKKKKTKYHRHFFTFYFFYPLLYVIIKGKMSSHNPYLTRFTCIHICLEKKINIYYLTDRHSFIELPTDGKSLSMALLKKKKNSVGSPLALTPWMPLMPLHYNLFLLLR